MEAFLNMLPASEEAARLEALEEEADAEAQAAQASEAERRMGAKFSSAVRATD